MWKEYRESLVPYVRETGAAVIAFLGGLIILVGNYLLDYFGVELPGPWISAGAIGLMIWGQFLVYHKLRRKNLALEARIAGLEGAEILLDEGLQFLGLDTYPDHWLETPHGTSVSLRLIQDQPAPFEVIVTCTAAIETGRAKIYGGVETQDGRPVSTKSYRRLAFRFDKTVTLPGEIDLPAGYPHELEDYDAALAIFLGAKEPIRLREVKVRPAPKPPEDPPETKA